MQTLVKFISATSLSNSYVLKATIGVSASQTVAITVANVGEKIVFGFNISTSSSTSLDKTISVNSGVPSSGAISFSDLYGAIRIMPLTKLQFKPGINREITKYSNEGGWVDCDKIRFRFGYPEKFGGWEKLTSNTYEGTARRLHNWLALDGSNFLGVGTHLKYYIEEGGTFNDITPVRSSTTNSTTFAATNGSANITVTETNHGVSRK